MQPLHRWDSFLRSSQGSARRPPLGSVMQSLRDWPPFDLQNVQTPGWVGCDELRPAVRTGSRGFYLGRGWQRRPHAGRRVASRDGGLQLHAIVGGGRLAASQLAHVIAILKQRSPTAQSVISITPAVSVDRYLLSTATFRDTGNLCCSLQPDEGFRHRPSPSEPNSYPNIASWARRPSVLAVGPVNIKSAECLNLPRFSGRCRDQAALGQLPSRVRGFAGKVARGLASVRTDRCSVRPDFLFLTGVKESFTLRQIRC